MFLELHIIQAFPPTCLNRDQANLPKECYFGGVRRARVSSQSWKNAIRGNDAFKRIVGEDHIGDLTKNTFREVVRQLKEKDQAKYASQEDLDIVLTELLGRYIDPKKGKDNAFDKNTKEKYRTVVPLFWSKQEIARIVSKVDQRWDELWPAVQTYKQVIAAKAQRDAEEKAREEAEKAKVEADSKKYKKPVKSKKDQKQDQDESKNSALGQLVSSMATELIKEAKSKRQGIKKTVVDAVDIAVYGRMIASHTDLEIHSACQFAHAFSTHAVEMETDFFTAVDTLPFDDDQGADMLGQQDYNSSCFYRYARLDLQQVRENLDGNEDLARKGIEGFMHAFFEAVPSAKRSAFDNNSQPSFALAVVRGWGAGWSLAAAFDKPIPSHPEHGYIEPSVKRLDTHWQSRRSKLDSVDDKGNSQKIKQLLILKVDEDFATPHLDQQATPTTNVDTWVKQTVNVLFAAEA